ncbi:MAG: metal ABC transporter permease [Prevotella sp.]
MNELLSYAFFRHALLGSLLTALVCGIVGTYIVARRMVFISGGLTHASFGGLGLGFYFHINPILTALGFSILAAFGVQRLNDNQQREDAVIASVWSLGMAIGIIFTFLSPGYAPSLSSYLFGNILLITSTDLIAMAILAIVLILFFVLFKREIIYTAFDRNFAFTQGLPVHLIEYTMMFFIAVTLVLSIRMVGIMLLMSVLTLPQMTLNNYTSDYQTMMIGSILIGFVGCLSGLALSYLYNIPSGALIVFVLVFFFFLSTAIQRLRQRINCNPKN